MLYRIVVIGYHILLFCSDHCPIDEKFGSISVLEHDCSIVSVFDYELLVISEHPDICSSQLETNKVFKSCVYLCVSLCFLHPDMYCFCRRDILYLEVFSSRIQCAFRIRLSLLYYVHMFLVVLF